MAATPRGSIEYLIVDLDVEAAQPVTIGVEVALIPRRGVPSDTDWKPAQWVDPEVRYLLDGTLPAGVYEVWIRATAAPEKILRHAGSLTVT